MKKETREQLDLFRRQQEEAERKALEEDKEDVPEENQVQWAAPSRKRKKEPESSFLKGVKLRKTSLATDEKGTANTTGNKKGAPGDAASSSAAKLTASATTASAVAPRSNPPVTLALGLGYASSDDDDD